MNYYMKKRLIKGLTRSEVSNYLGIDYKRYLSIERGNVKMPKNLIDRFNEFVNRGKSENKIDRLNREELVNNWWNEVINDKEVLKNKMKEFNIESYKELGILLGYKDGSVICTYVNKLREPNFDFKNKLYNFFENELNIQEPEINKPKIKSGRSYALKYNQEDLEWYRSFDKKKWLNEYNLLLNDFADYINMPHSTFYYFVNQRNNQERLPYQRNIVKVREGIEKYEREHTQEIIALDAKESKIIGEITQEYKEDEILTPKFLVDMMEKPEEVTLRDKLINKYTNIIDNLEGQATDIVKEISRLRDKLDDITKQRLIYSELLNDIEEVE